MPGVIPKTVNAQQRRAIEHGDGPLLIVAGAGTGKTTVITQRVAWLLLQKGLKPHEVLALTFTDKAAGEMVDRVDRILPYGYVELWIQTFHAFCQKILTAHALDIGLPSDFRLLRGTDAWLLVRRNLTRFDLDYYRPAGNPTRFLHSLLQHFSRAKDEAVSPGDYLAFVEHMALDRDRDPSIAGLDGAAKDIELKRLRELANAYATYEKLLLEERALDFGDLIVRTFELFQQRPQILHRYRKQFKAILVDEFQDTNWAQYELVKLLAAPANNLTVVGDDDQSIYKFRGASLANILQFKRDYPSTAEVVLTTNYRSKQNLLDAAYKFIVQNNPNRLEARLAGGGGRERSVPISKKLTATRKGPGILETIVAETEAGETDAVVGKILERKHSKEVKWDDFAVLVRANDHAEPFLSALDRAGVPYQFLASRGLYRKEIVLDILSFLRLLDNYHESDALYRVLSFPFWKVPTGDLIELGAFARRRGRSLFEAARDPEAAAKLTADGRSRVSRVLSLVEKFTADARTKPVSILINDFLHDSGYLTAVVAADDARKQTDLLLLNHFLRKVLEFEHASEDRSVRAFVQAIQLEREAGEAGALAGAFDEGPEAVKVMTVHGAKGLEFRFVFLVQLVDKRFPSVERPDPIPLPDALVKEEVPEGDLHLEEERRLMYVAMTRARDGLFLTRAVDYGGARDKKPSRFLVELGLAKAEDAKAKRRAPSIPRSPRAPAPPLEPALAEVVERKVSFSFTELDTFETCPWKYRYAFVLAVPSGKGPQASFGSTVHATLRDFFHQIQERAGATQAGLFGARSEAKPFDPPTLPEFLAMYDANWIDDWYESNRQREEFRKRGREALTRFYEAHSGKFPVPRFLEQNFTVSLDPFHFRGAIDRVDVITEAPKAGVEIVDYKTGSMSDDKLKRNRLQLSLYALAVEDPNVFNLKVEKLTFEYIEEGKRESFGPKSEDLAKARQWALATIEKIKSGDFHPTPGQVCRFCDFRSICPYRAA